MTWFERLKAIILRKPLSNDPEKHPFWNFERDSPRRAMALFVRISGEEFFKEFKGEVGIGGFSFNSPGAFQQQANLDIQFNLPDPSVSILCRGEVKDCQTAPSGFVVRGFFSSMNLEDKKILARWLYESALKKTTS